MSGQGSSRDNTVIESDSARTAVRLVEVPPSGEEIGTTVMSELDIRIISMVADGYGIDAVARTLNLSTRTVRRHTQAMRDRLGARAPIQVAVWAARHGLI